MKYLVTSRQLKNLSKSIIKEKKGYGASKTYKDYPQTAVNNAKKVLEWKKKHPNEVNAMTRVGWKRARQIANKEPLSYETVKRIYKFKRHKKNATVAARFKTKPWKDKGHVAWLGWGGTPMINWAENIVNKVENK